MKFRLTPPHDDRSVDVKITRPFAVYFHPEDDDLGGIDWIAKIVGADVPDHMTFADNPVCAAYMVYDLLALLTNTCVDPRHGADDVHPDHDWSVETTMEDPSRYDAETDTYGQRPAIACSHCRWKAPREHFVTEDEPI